MSPSRLDEIEGREVYHWTAEPLDKYPLAPGSCLVTVEERDMLVRAVRAGYALASHVCGSVRCEEIMDVEPELYSLMLAAGDAGRPLLEERLRAERP